MSHTFSRRTFFKYSAAAAVAAAGMSLLGGCGSLDDPNNPYSTVLGTSIENLDVIATVRKTDTDVEKGIFSVVIQNNRGNPLILNPSNFSVCVYTPQDKVDEKTGEVSEVTASKYYSLNYGGVKLTGLTDNSLAQGDAVKFTVTAPNFPTEIKRDETVMLKYIPITTSVYAAYSMAWRITKEADDYSDIKQPETTT